MMVQTFQSMQNKNHSERLLNFPSMEFAVLLQLDLSSHFHPQSLTKILHHLHHKTSENYQIPYLDYQHLLLPYQICFFLHYAFRGMFQSADHTPQACPKDLSAPVSSFSPSSPLRNSWKPIQAHTIAPLFSTRSRVVQDLPGSLLLCYRSVPPPPSTKTVRRQNRLLSVAHWYHHPMQHYSLSW